MGDVYKTNYKRSVGKHGDDTLSDEDTVLGSELLTRTGNWLEFTPISTWISGDFNFEKSYYRRVGDSIDIMTALKFSGSLISAASGTVLSIEYPSGLAVSDIRASLAQRHLAAGDIAVSNLELEDPIILGTVLTYGDGTNSNKFRPVLYVRPSGSIYIQREHITADGTWSSGNYISMSVYNVPVSGWENL